MKIDKKIVIIPGVQKSGTSTLSELIARHQSMCSLTNSSGDAIKETNFFSHTGDIVRKNLGWYESLFRSKKSPHVDASPSYFISPMAPDLIDEFLADVKCIIIVRDPIERAHSNYLHMKNKVPKVEGRTFNQIVGSIYSEKKSDVKESENRVMQRAIENEKIDPVYLEKRGIAHNLSSPFQAHFQDPLQPYKYLQKSEYSRWINMWKKSNFETKVICLEEMIEKPKKVVNEVCDHIGIKNVKNVDMIHRNKTKSLNSTGKFLSDTCKFLKNSEIVKRIFEIKFFDYLKKGVREKLVKERGSAKNKIDDKSLDRLLELFDEEYDYWKERRPEFVKRWEYSC